MPLHDGVDDGQAQAGAVAALAGPAPAEAPSRLADVGLGHPGTGVAHAQDDAIGRTLDPQGDGAFFGGVLDGVVHQIDERFPQQPFDTGHRGAEFAAVHGDGLPLLARQAVELADDVLGQGRERHGPGRVVVAVGFAGAGERQHLRGRTLRLVQAAAHGQQGRARLGGVGFPQGVVQLGMQDGQRRAQLVRGVVQELALPARLAGVAGDVLVDGVHQRPDLAGEFRRGNRAEIVGRPALQLAVQARERPQADQHADDDQAGGGQHLDQVAHDVADHHVADHLVPAAPVLAHHDDDPSVRLPVERRRHGPGQGGDADGGAQIVAVVEHRRVRGQARVGQRQVLVADVGQSVLGQDPVVDRVVGGELEEFEHQVGQFHGQAAAGGGDVVIDGAQGARQGPVVGQVDLLVQLAAGKPQRQAQDRDLGRHQDPQQQGPEAAGPAFSLARHGSAPGNSPSRAA